MAPSNWLTGKPYSAARRRVRTLTNNAYRGSNNWSGFKTAGLGMGGVRRLMKKDPSVAQGMSPAEMRPMMTTSGMSDGGRSQGVRTLSKSKTAAPNAGTRVIKPPTKGRLKRR